MNKFRLPVAIALTCCQLTVLADVTSKSYLSLRPRFEINEPERILMFRHRMDLRKQGHGGALQVVGMYGQTSNPAEIAKYFLPNDKDYIIIGEDASNSSIRRTRDINAFHFGILTAPLTQSEIDGGFTSLTFESILSLCPKQTLAGVGFAYQHRLPNHFWIEVAAPITHVKNTLGLSELIKNTGGGHVPDDYFGSAIAALSDCNCNLHYGRMSTRPLRKTKLAFIDARIGRDIRWEDVCLLGGFLGGIIPTGNKPRACYLFEPIVGNNQHWGVMIGSYGVFELMRDRHDWTLSVCYNITTRYLIANNQTRSFDLRGKPWSRYMKVWVDDNYGQALATSEWQSHLDYLINYSTLCVRVRPDANIDISVELNYKHRGFNMDLGYNAYARKAEDIYFTHAIKDNIGLPAIRWYLDGNRVPATESKATIETPLFKINPGYADQVLNPNGQETSTTYLSITTDDLNPMSAAHPSCLAYMIYGSMGYEWNQCKYPTCLNAGISYEFSHDNTFTKRWLAWLKIGVSI